MSLQPELPLWFTDEQVANMSTDAAAAFQIMVDAVSGGTQVASDTTQDVSNQNSNAEPEPADDGPLAFHQIQLVGVYLKIVMLNQNLQMMGP